MRACRPTHPTLLFNFGLLAESHFGKREYRVPKDRIYIYVTYNTFICNLDEKMVKVYAYYRRIKKLRLKSKYGICQIRINDPNIRQNIENF